MDLQDTEAWDPKYNLPTFQSMNPHAFTAYCVTALEHKGKHSEAAEILQTYWRFLYDCTVFKSQPKYTGLYHRYPDGSAGNISWDEIIGISSLAPLGARHAREYLFLHLGCYDDQNPGTWSFRRNLYRFPFLTALLKIGGGDWLGPIGRVVLALWYLWDALSSDPGMSGHLQHWLYREYVKPHWGAHLGVIFWDWRMKKRGIDETTMLTKYFWDKPKFIEWVKGAT